MTSEDEYVYELLKRMHELEREVARSKIRIGILETYADQVTDFLTAMPSITHLPPGRPVDPE